MGIWARIVPFIPVLGLGILAGCDGTPTDYMPMEVGTRNTYVVRSAFVGMVEPVEVVRKTSVAGVTGVELRSPMGISKVAWRNGRLVADQLTHTRFAPPIHLLAPSEGAGPIPWSGTIYILNGEYPAKGNLRQEPVQEEILGKPMKGTKSILRIEIPKLERTISVESTFVRGIGLARQVQRTNGLQDFDLRLLYDAP